MAVTVNVFRPRRWPLLALGAAMVVGGCLMLLAPNGDGTWESSAQQSFLSILVILVGLGAGGTDVNRRIELTRDETLVAYNLLGKPSCVIQLGKDFTVADEGTSDAGVKIFEVTAGFSSTKFDATFSDYEILLRRLLAYDTCRSSLKTSHSKVL